MNAPTFFADFRQKVPAGVRSAGIDPVTRARDSGVGSVSQGNLRTRGNAVRPAGKNQPIKAAAAPATVSGERRVHSATGCLIREGGPKGATTREPGDLPVHGSVNAVGCDGSERKNAMSIQVSARETLAWSSLAPAVALAVVLGAAIIYVSGHLQTTALHDAAHDVRHATGFPCH